MENFQDGEINSHNKWDKLKEIIVRTSKGTTITLTWSKNEPLKPEIIKMLAQLLVALLPQFHISLK